MDIARWLFGVGVGLMVGLLSTEKKRGRRISYVVAGVLIAGGSITSLVSVFRPSPKAASPYSHISMHCESGRTGTPDAVFVLSDQSLRLYARGNLPYGPFGPAVFGNASAATLPASSVATCSVYNDYPSPVFGFIGSFAYKLTATSGQTSFGNMAKNRELVFISRRITSTSPARFQVANAVSGGRMLFVAPTLDCVIDLPGGSGTQPCVLPAPFPGLPSAIPGVAEFPVTLTDKDGNL